MSSATLEAIITAIAGIVTGAFFTVRYAIKENSRSKQEFMDFINLQTKQNLDYNENKNGHLERISKMFASAMNKNAKAIDKLTVNIKGLVRQHEEKNGK